MRHWATDCCDVKFSPSSRCYQRLQHYCDLTPAGTVRRLYLQHLVASTPSNKLRALLEPLTTPEVRKRIQIDVDYLLDHPDEIVPYFTSIETDEVLQLFAPLVKGQRIDLRNLTLRQQQQLKKLVDDRTMAEWVAKKYRNGRADPDVVSSTAWGLLLLLLPTQCCLLPISF